MLPMTLVLLLVPAATTATDVRQNALEGEEISMPGVVSIQGPGQCTGTLIAPNLVVTARHCFYHLQTPPNSPCSHEYGEAMAPLGDYSVTVTTHADEATDDDTFQIVRLDERPGRLVCGNDLAVAVLDRPVPETLATPIAPRMASLPARDEVVRAVGFGITRPDEPDSYGVRRITEGIVGCEPGRFCGSAIEDNEWVGYVNTCIGDSGGPALDEDGRLIGILSRGSNVCSSGIYITPRDPIVVFAVEEQVELGVFDRPAWLDGADPAPPPSGDEECTDFDHPPQPGVADPCDKSDDFGDVNGESEDAPACSSTANDSPFSLIGWGFLGGALLFGRRRRRRS